MLRKRIGKSRITEPFQSLLYLIIALKWIYLFLDVRIQKGLKPLAKKSFYLDIKNHAASAKLEAKIKDLGGVSVVILVRI